jgi:DNA primase
MQEIKKQILSRINLASLIGETVSLQKKGDFATGLCPFHEENTPSFYVYHDHYHCYGCGEHGDAISFVRKMQGFAFMDSLRWLGDRVGISLSSTEDEKKYAEEWKKKSRQTQVLLAAKDFFTSQFKDPFEGKFAREYLTSRHLSDTIVQELGIGYAPAFSDSLWAHLNKLGFHAEDLAACSLINQSRGRVYDFFQNRLILPIRDEQSRIIAFTGRALGDELPKYKNSRFEKGHFLFGLDRARTGIRQKSRAIIVEGHFDALQMWNHGFHETVACQGTALTQEHLRKLHAFTHQIILIFDGDEAGRRAALKTLDQAFHFPDMHFKVALLPQDEDPDSLLQKQGAHAMEQVLEKCEDLLDFAITERLRTAPQTGVADLISNTILPWLQEVRDPIRRSLLLQKISQQTGISADLLSSESKPAAQKKSQSLPQTPVMNESYELQPLEKEFLGHLYYAQAHQTPIQDVEELLQNYLELPGFWSDFAKELLLSLKNGDTPEHKSFDSWVSAQHAPLQAFLEFIRNRKKAYLSQGDFSPFMVLRLEARKKGLRKTLEILKQKTMTFKAQKVEDATLWSHLTHSLIRTTQELESVDIILRRRGSSDLSSRT